MAASRAFLLFLAFLLLLCGSGCASIPKGAAAVDSVDVEGNDAISESDIEEKIATTESPKFLQLFRGVVYDYELFDKAVLQRDLERVERLYRARGYYEAKARAGRVRYKSDTHVEVTIEVEEGPVVLVGTVKVEGLEELDPRERKAIESEAGALVKGEPFVEETFDKTREAMVRALTNRGFAFAKVQQKADVDLPNRRAHVTYAVTRGPKAKFGTVKIEGLRELPEDIVRRTVDIAPGDPYSTDRIDRAREAVLALGTFGSVDIVPQLEPPPPNAVVPLVVKVHEQRLKSVVLGGGIELDSIRAQFHLHAGWEHKNLFGGFRKFNVDFKPGLDLYPTRIPDFQAPTAVLPEEKLVATLRQPSFLEARTTGFVSQELNTYPVLLAEKVDPAAPVIGYFEYKGSVGLERTFWKLFGSPSYTFQYNLPFAYQGELDPNLRGIILSYVGLKTHFDLRDNRLKPHSGIYLEDDVQFAGLGGDARDFRIQPEARGYIPIGKKVTVAARFTVGLLFPLNYGDAATAHAERRDRPYEPSAVTTDMELVYFRGFFSGGPSSNRGYPLRGVGPHGSVPFFNPGLAATQLASECAPDNPAYDELRCSVPLGGQSLWEASLEVRFPILDPVGGVVFCDASDVSARRLDLRFTYPHLSCGAGLRIDTPIGPVRADLGYRIPGAQVPAGADLALEGEPGTIYGAPIALAFGIGEAF